MMLGLISVVANFLRPKDDEVPVTGEVRNLTMDDARRIGEFQGTYNVLDVSKAERLMNRFARADSEVYFGIQEDWSATAADRLDDAWTHSHWGTPGVMIDGVFYPCFKIIKHSSENLRRLK